MRAFVFSGGGNRGPLQVGAVKALLERGIRPDMVIGCSAGALNAAYLSREFSTEMVEELAQVWRETTLDDIYPGSRMGTCGALSAARIAFTTIAISTIFCNDPARPQPRPWRRHRPFGFSSRPRI